MQSTYWLCSTAGDKPEVRALTQNLTKTNSIILKNVFIIYAEYINPLNIFNIFFLDASCNFLIQVIDFMQLE